MAHAGKLADTSSASKGLSERQLAKTLAWQTAAAKKGTLRNAGRRSIGKADQATIGKVSKKFVGRQGVKIGDNRIAGLQRDGFRHSYRTPKGATKANGRWGANFEVFKSKPSAKGQSYGKGKIYNGHAGKV